MYRRRGLVIFATICCVTFLLNYTVVKNLDEMGFLRKTTTAGDVAFTIAKLSSDALTLKILNYRRNRSSDNLFFGLSFPDMSSNNLFSVNSTSTVNLPSSEMSNMIEGENDSEWLESNNLIGMSSNINNNVHLNSPSRSNSTASRVASSSCSYLNRGNNSVSSYYEKSRRRYSGAQKKAHERFTFLPDYVVASMTFDCNETITYTSHGDFRYLDNLVPLVERWEGPISLALYAPGSDFDKTVTRIQFLRECTSPLVKLLVTFHIFYDTKFIKETPTSSPLQNSATIDCKNIPDFGEDLPSFRKEKSLSYPVNVARNLARRQANTHFILASDIELYPSVNIIPQFLEMIVREQALHMLKVQNGEVSPQNDDFNKPRVYVLPIFEVEETEEIPNTKEDLTAILKRNKAVPFHKFVCPECHKVPKYASWLKKLQPADSPPSLSVFHVAKRKRPFQFWEPIFIGTNREPFYDERLSWEGLRDKMSQGFILCIMDYDFMILDNAFLVHRPGIKKKKRPKKTTLAIRRQNRLLGTRITNEIIKTYGKRPGCYL